MVAIPNVLVADEAEKVICDAAVGCGFELVLGLGLTTLVNSHATPVRSAFFRSSPENTPDISLAFPEHNPSRLGLIQ